MCLCSLQQLQAQQYTSILYSLTLLRCVIIS
ncbi:hypothetical protein [Escherichia phage vB-Eco-KMB37]|nr:hypothetical protein [Escherichia phage vB-Eco-KMB37]